MGKATRQVLEKRGQAEAVIAQALSRRNANLSKQFYRESVAAWQIMPETADAWQDKAIRNPQLWSYKGKSRDKAKQQIDLIRYMFAKYPVPSFLELTFLDSKSPFVEWYIAVAQGRSLYKTCTSGQLSKKENHWLLKAPDDLTILEAIWWAKTMAITEDIGVAYRMAKSIISVRGSHTKEFWIDLHRFFTHNPVQMKEMQELIDYCVAMHGENKNWTIKKRSLNSLRDQSERWHRSMAKMKQIGGGSWIGMQLGTWEFKTGKHDDNPTKNTEVTWTIREICSGNELAKEGNQMRHCVWGYKQRCINGQCSIFTMTSVDAFGKISKNLTIEVQRSYKQVVQARGLANRMPRPQEREVLRKWGNAHGITISNYYC